MDKSIVYLTPNPLKWVAKPTLQLDSLPLILLKCTPMDKSIGNYGLTDD